MTSLQYKATSTKVADTMIIMLMNLIWYNNKIVNDFKTYRYALDFDSRFIDVSAKQDSNKSNKYINKLLTLKLTQA